MASRYFINIGTSFNSTANWSTSSGGSGGASIPGSSDVAFFDANSGNCTIDTNINVIGSNSTGYTNTVTQGTFTITVGSSNFVWVAGTFIGSASSITCTGSLLVTGGTFTNTSGTCTVSGNFTSQGTYAHNNGNVILNASNAITITNGSFYDMEINKTGFSSIVTIATTNIIVSHNFTLTASNGWIGNNIEVRGDYSGSFLSDNGAGKKVIMNGTGTQNVSGTACGLDFEINKASGTLNFNSNITFGNSYNLLAGTVNWNTFKATMGGANNIANITNGTFYDLEINRIGFGGGINLVASNLVVLNDFTMTASAQSMTGGKSVEVRRNFINNGGSCSPVIMNGTAAQTITATTSFPNSISINKASGTCSLISNLTVSGSGNDLNLILGTFDQNGFNLNIPDSLSQTGGTYNQGAGSLTLVNFSLTAGTFNEGTQGIILTGTTFTIGVSGVFNYHANGGITANTGSNQLTINCNGNIINRLTYSRGASDLVLSSNFIVLKDYTFNGTGHHKGSFIIGCHRKVIFDGSTSVAACATVNFIGISDQEYTSNNATINSSKYTLNKPSGNVFITKNTNINSGSASNKLAVLTKGVFCTNEFNLTATDGYTIGSKAFLQKTPTSVVTGAVTGTITNVIKINQRQKNALMMA